MSSNLDTMYHVDNSNTNSRIYPNAAKSRNVGILQLVLMLFLNHGHLLLIA